MQKNRTLILGLVASLLLVSVLAACGPVMSTPTPKPAPTATPEPQPTATEAPTTSTSNEPTTEEGAMTTASGLQYIERTKGEGPSPEAGQIVSVHYKGTLEDGTEFDNSFTRGEPIAFPLGKGFVIPGWDEGIALMNVGGSAKLIIPPELGYGSQGAGGVIPPDATLVFEVELIEILPGAPEAPTRVAEEDYTVTDSGLKYYDFEVGEGEEISGKQALVNYTGWLTDGTKFDSSLDRGQPFALVVGVGQVIPGWDEGLGTMRLGGKRQLVIPSDLAYGADGAGNIIPPNADLVFEVEIVEVP